MFAEVSLSATQEDYLEIIFGLARDNRVARVRDIARAKGVRMASVTDALRRLDGRGLVRYQAREYVQLTSEGEAQAQRIAGRHAFLTRFLTEILLVDPVQAEQDACEMEHCLSPGTLERLASFYQFVHTCPQSHPAFLESFARCMEHTGCHEAGIPGTPACDTCPTQSAGGEPRLYVPLADLVPGQGGVVHRIGSSGIVRRRLIEMGVLPGTRIEVEGVAPLGDPIRVKIRGYRLSLRNEEAAAILLDHVEDGG